MRVDTAAATGVACSIVEHLLRGGNRVAIRDQSYPNRSGRNLAPADLAGRCARDNREVGNVG